VIKNRTSPPDDTASVSSCSITIKPSRKQCVNCSSYYRLIRCVHPCILITGSGIAENGTYSGSLRSIIQGLKRTTDEIS